MPINKKEEQLRLIALTEQRQRIGLKLYSFFNGVCEMKKPFEKNDLDTLVSKMACIIQEELKDQSKSILEAKKDYLNREIKTLETVLALLNGDDNQVDVLKNYAFNKLKVLISQST